MRWMEGKICPIYCFDVLQGGCIVESHDNILMLLVSIMMPLDWGNYNIQQSARIRVVIARGRTWFNHITRVVTV